MHSLTHYSMHPAVKGLSEHFDLLSRHQPYPLCRLRPVAPRRLLVVEILAQRLMLHHIHHWQRHYRVRTAAEGRRLDALAAGPVMAAYEAAVEQSVGATDEVILVRRVNVRLALRHDAADAGRPARQWGDAMAAGLQRTLRDNEPDNIARYADAADHLAAFVAAALADTAKDDWRFARFARCHGESVAATIVSALINHAELCPIVLSRLLQKGLLSPMLAAIGPTEARRIWVENIAGPSAPTPDEERPLFAAAIGLVTALLDMEVKASWVERKFAEYISEHRPNTDWNDSTHLAAGVLAAVRFLLRTADVKSTPAAEFIVAAVKPLDWLDREWLVQQLETLLMARVGPQLMPTVSRPSGATPRQREWLAALLATLPRVQDHLNRSDVSSEKNAMLLFAALVERYPAWAGDVAVSSFIDTMLRAADVIRQHGRATTDSSPASAALRMIAECGEPAQAVVTALLGRNPVTPRHQTQHSVADIGEVTAAAGVFLLWRTFQDLRLSALVRSCEFPCTGSKGSQQFRLALAARLAGLDMADANDPGLLAFSGVAVPIDRAVWQTAPTAAYAEALDAMCMAQRLAVTSPSADTFALGLLGHHAVDELIALTAEVVVRAWARWLKHLGHSGTLYLLNTCLRRPGRITRNERTLDIELASRPLDTVLRASGYLAPIKPIFGSDEPMLRFRIGEVR